MDIFIEVKSIFLICMRNVIEMVEVRVTGRAKEADVRQPVI